MISAISLVDLDDTLFQTLRKCPGDVPPERLACRAVDRAGEPLSFATPRQQAFIGWLEATTAVVAVTARSGDALSRVDLAWRYAVIAHGGAVLSAGSPPSPCPGYAPRLGADAATLEELAAVINADAAADGGEVRARTLYENGAALYVVAKDYGPGPDEARLACACAGAVARIGDDWTMHANGNNVALLPPGLGKANAVAWLLPQLRTMHPDLPVIGIGDSLTDAGFMALADFAMTPAGSQLGRRLIEDGREG